MIERHFTVTTYVLQEKKVLLLFHPKLHKWLPPGGHLELNETPPECACREVKEETGLDIELIPQENVWVNALNAKSIERPYLCLLENVPPHGPHPAHQHIDLIYLGKPIGGTITPSPDLRWYTRSEAEELRVDEEIFSDVIEVIRKIL